jgi:hypothetical protein
MTSSRRTSKIGSSEAGTSAVTYPAPARIAASEAMQGAPVSPVEPPQTITCPALNLVESRPRRGTWSSTALPIRPIDGAAGPPSGIPIGTVRTSPACALPG